MVDGKLDSGEPQGDTTTVLYTWRQGLFSFFIFLCLIVIFALMLNRRAAQEIRPLYLLGYLIWILTIWALTWRRKKIKERAPQESNYRWYRFSMLELLWIFTGIAIFVGFMAADNNQQRSVQRERERLQIVTADILGVDGLLAFESDGSLSISVCDRSFDDRRFVELAEQLHDYIESYGVSRVLFGTGPGTAGTPPRWPGVTDASIDILLEWQDLQKLSIEGTGITPAGQKLLLKLDNLDDSSRKDLAHE